MQHNTYLLAVYSQYSRQHFEKHVQIHTRSNASAEVCHDSCMTICTGLTSLNVSNTRLASQCTAVCRVRRPSTLPTVVLQPQRLLADTTYARPVDITCLYHVTGSVPSVVEPSLFEAGLSGTLYRTVSKTRLGRLSAATASGNYLRRTSSTVTYHTQRCRDAVTILRYNVQMTSTTTLTNRL